jgi:hypothetical protein
MTFETWFKELKQIAVAQHGFLAETTDTFYEPSFKVYFDEGFSPAEAMAEDMSCA